MTVEAPVNADILQVRLLIQTGWRLEQLTVADLAEFTAACRDRQQRTGKGHLHYLAAVRCRLVACYTRSGCAGPGRDDGSVLASFGAPDVASSAAIGTLPRFLTSMWIRSPGCSWSYRLIRHQ
ncbi:hypothetical protein [Pedococcus sp. P5_B7]